jgi:hypothetical protein
LHSRCNLLVGEEETWLYTLAMLQELTSTLWSRVNNFGMYDGILMIERDSINHNDFYQLNNVLRCYIDFGNHVIELISTLKQ